MPCLFRVAQRTEDVEKKTDEAMVGCEGKQNPIHQNNMLEVVNDRLAVEKVHGSRKPVPVQALGGPQGSLTAGNVGDSNDFLERNDLDGRDDTKNVDMAHKEGQEETGKHDKGPEGACHEVGLFLLVLGLLLLGGGLGLLFRYNVSILIPSSLRSQPVQYLSCLRGRFFFFTSSTVSS